MIGDSQRAARYSGMRTRRKILAVMGLSGAIAGLGGASQVGDFSHVLDASPQGLQGAAFGYTGIVVAALARYNPLAVVLVGVLIGGLQNAGLYLQGADFPTGLVGVHAGDHPVLHARRRAADPLPRAVRAASRAQPPQRRRRSERQRHRSSSSCSPRRSSTGRRSCSRRSASCSPSGPGVLNLGVEGMMLIGAVMGFWAMQRGPGPTGARPAARGADRRVRRARSSR